MSTDSIIIDWSECIIIFNSLMKNIEELRNTIDANEIDDDDLFDAEEDLNDYVTLLVHLKERYSNLQDAGDLTSDMKKKLNNILLE